MATKKLNQCHRVTAFACLGDLLGFKYISHSGKSPGKGVDCHTTGKTPVVRNDTNFRVSCSLSSALGGVVSLEMTA
jgi:hypothetical protein